MKGKNVLVYGTGLSGIAAGRLLDRNGAKVLLYDENEKLDKKELAQKAACINIEDIHVGKLEDEVLNETDLAVLSPGVPLDNENVIKIKEKGIPIWGEIELGYYFHKGDILAITGTNGKTTTTALLGEIMKKGYKSVSVVGNIGYPFTEVADKTGEGHVTVAEISSFQLETIEGFRPKVSAVLNITEDHLNRHHTMENYAACKMRIAEKQGGDDFCVLNYEDDYLKKAAKSIKTNVFYFSSARKLENGIYLDGDDIIIRRGEEEINLINVNELQIIGEHNFENVMAASAMAYLYGMDIEKISIALKEFTAVEHRIEFVDEIDGVRYYNDSKGTNPDASIKAVKAMKWPTILIAGGYDKESGYDDFINSFEGKVKKMVLIGQTANKIADCAKENGFEDYVFADSFEEAFNICKNSAVSGDAVLLSPACASWGMFKNFEERGDIFKELVRGLRRYSKRIK